MEKIIQIIDLDGEPLRINHLEEAIDLARIYSGYSTDNEVYKDFVESRNRYWADVLEKLLKIKKQQDGQSQT